MTIQSNEDLYVIELKGKFYPTRGWWVEDFIDYQYYDDIICIPPRTLPLDYWDCDKAKGVVLHSPVLDNTEPAAIFFWGWSNADAIWQRMDMYTPKHQRLIVC